MHTTLDQPEVASAQPLRIDGRKFYSVLADLCEIADRNLKRSDYFGRCFEAICGYLDASVGLLNLRLGARTLERSYSVDEKLSQGWADAIDTLVLQAQTDEMALARLYRNRAGETVAYALAAPVLSKHGNPFGALALVVNRSSFEDSESELVQICQLLELVVENAPSPEAKGASDSKAESIALQSVVRASDYRSIHHLSIAIVNSLCNKFRCEQVAIGLVQNRNVKLMALSGKSEIPKNTPGVMAVQQAMAVCTDRNEPSVVQQEGRMVGQIDSSPCKIHQFWHRLTGESAVATLPLRVDGKCVAAVAIRRPANQPLMPEDLQRIQLLAESFAPALPLVDRASRSVVRHVAESATATLSRLYSWKHLGPKAIAVGLMALMAWMVFGKIDHKILAPCQVVPDQLFTVSAPHEGMIESVHVMPGQHVKKGQLLVQLDTKDLLVERQRIRASIASAQIEANHFLEKRLPQKAFLKQAEIEVQKTDLQLIEEQIRRSQIRAHQNGIVMPTEIHRQVGQFVALGDPLLELADENRWRLDISVPESDVQYLSLEQIGTFQSNARPEKRLGVSFEQGQSFLRGQGKQKCRRGRSRIARAGTLDESRDGRIRSHQYR